MKTFYLFKTCFIAVALIAASVLTNFAQTVRLPAGIERVASVEGITEYRLSNGLQILLFPDPTKQNITVNIVYRVGSRHENYGETGMAHLLEHLVFKGTPRHPNILAELNERGARPNGTTFYDRTNYFETFAASDENLEWALDLEADRMVNSYISKKDLDAEMTVVRNEMEAGENTAFRVLIDKMTATAYQWHNYGKTTIGARSDVENVQIENLQAFYRKYYQPDNATLAVAGKIDEIKTLDLIKQKFGAIPKPARVLPKSYTVEPVQDGERQVTVRRVGESQYLLAGYHIPPAAHPDYAAVIVMQNILSDTPSGRLYKALVETKKAAFVFHGDFKTKEPGLAIFAAELAKNAPLDPARDAMIETIENFAARPPSKEEVERFKANALKNIELSFNEPNTIALQMTTWVAQGDWRLLFLYRDRLKRITPEDVQRVAKTYLLESNRTLGVFVPTEKPVRAQIPTVSDTEIAGMVKDYKGESTVAAGEAFDPSPANVESRTRRGQIGGLKTAFLSKKNRGESVALRLTLRLGDAESLMNRAPAGVFAAQLLMRGTTAKSRQQIKDEFDRFKAQGWIDGNATNVVATVKTNRQNLPEVLKLVAEITQQPAFSSSEFEQFKQEILIDLEAGRSDPEAVAFRAMNRAFNRYPKGDVRYAGSLDEDIAETKAVTLDAVKKFHRDFYGASTGELAIVGDFDAQEIAPVVTRLFGNWKSPTGFGRVPEEYADVAAVNQSFETPDKANATFFARANVKMRDDNPDYAAFTLGNFMLGGGFLNSRLANRIRQKEGLSYQIASVLSVASLDEYATFTASAIYAPENANRLEAAFKEEIARVVKDGFTVEEIAQAKTGWLLNQQRARGDDEEIARTLANHLFINRTFAWQDELEKKIRALTPEQVNAAMRKYLAPDKISIFKAGDFAKTKTQ